MFSAECWTQTSAEGAIGCSDAVFANARCRDFHHCLLDLESPSSGTSLMEPPAFLCRRLGLEEN